MVVMTTRARSVVLVVALALAASLLTLAVVLAKPAQAQAETYTDTYRDTFSFYTYSCDPGGEYVLIEGTLQTVAHTTIDANGGYHTKFQYKLQGQGEGLDSGDKYVFNDVFNYQQNYSLAMNENYNFTQTETFKITRQGSASATDDLQAKVLYHITVNANGEVTAEVINFEYECT